MTALPRTTYEDLGKMGYTANEVAQALIEGGGISGPVVR